MTLLKNKSRQIRIIYVIILLLYPMLRINQGLSIMDTTYSLSNYAFFGEMNGTWMVATYLSNVVGSALMHLPFGSTMLGINLYPSLIAGLTAVSAFMFLKREINQNILFLAEIIALCLCWCPTTILYNYLTYMLFTVGALVLYRGLCGGRDDCFVAAGILLGLNVGSRFPNITEAALIVAVWYVGIISHKKFVRVVKETLMCLGGYVIGFLIPYVTIAIRYTSDAYSDMIHNLFAMTDKAQDYKPTSMITAMFEDYLYAGKWIVLFIAGMLACGIIYFIAEKILTAKKLLVEVVLSAIVMLGVVRICYGQGMFSFRFYEYGSMYYWAVLMIATATVMCLIYIFTPDTDCDAVFGEPMNLHRKKILSMIVLIVIYITCLGSNNALYPIVNNTFIVAAYVLWVTYDWLRDILNTKENSQELTKKGLSSVLKAIKYSGVILSGVIVFFTLIQGIGFHMCFELQDGDDGSKRIATVTGFDRTAGIYTTEANASGIQGVMDYVAKNGGDVREVILYGNTPGFGYLLNKSSALTTFWPDLDSFTYDEWTRDLNVIESEVKAQMPAPYIITSIQVAAWEGADEAACDYWGVDKEAFGEDKKLEDLIEFMHSCGYKQVYCNDAYSIYYVE